MAKLFEYQSKEILKKYGVKIPEGGIAKTKQEAVDIAEKIGYPVVIKVQIWETGRKGKGGIAFCEDAKCVEEYAEKFLGMEWGQFTVDTILIEKKLSIKQELFAGFIIDDATAEPVLIFSSIGGSGIEEIANAHPDKVAKMHIDYTRGLYSYQAREVARKTGIKGKILNKIGTTLAKLYKAMKEYDARSLETNPLGITEDGDVVALDAHIVIDDYGAFRHPDLGIEIAREFPRPATELEKIAWNVEKNDYRGTFYFIQMVKDVPDDGTHIGFHGAGGGGSMMSMDAVLNAGFKIANFTDTSGNPPASKVYRAAKIILSQPNIVGYFASGSGVASQEQFHSARGFVKAFLEDNIDIPAVLRLGGNYEEKAVEILHTYLKDLPCKVEGYKKDDSPDFCADRLKKLVEENGRKPHKVVPHKAYEPKGTEYVIETMTGHIYIDHALCEKCEEKPCVDACQYDVIELKDGKPMLKIDKEDAKKGKCTECLACEIACKFHGEGAIHIDLPIPGLKEYREKIIEKQGG